MSEIRDESSVTLTCATGSINSDVESKAKCVMDSRLARSLLDGSDEHSNDAHPDFLSECINRDENYINENNAGPQSGISLKPWCVVVNIKFPYNTVMVINDLPDGLPFDLLKRLLATECFDRVKNLKLLYDGSVIKSGQTPKRLLNDLSTVPQIECNFKHPSRTTKIHLGRRTLKLSRSDEIHVYIYKGEESEKDKQPDNLNVILEKPAPDGVPHMVQINWVADIPPRPFLGGYRRMTDNVEFHHATSQSFPKPIQTPIGPMSSRETQTFEMKHAAQDTLKPSSTSMTKVGYYVTNIEDRLVSPRPYETAAEYESRRVRSAILIQKHVRRWLAKMKVARLKRLRDLYYRYLEEEERKYQEEKANRFKKDYDRRSAPKRRADFDRLFEALEQWRKTEVAKIYRSSKTLADRKANMGLLVDREVELIVKISRHQIEISKYGRLREQEHYLEKAAATNRWTAAHSGELVEKDTPNTLRAKELLIMYENLKSDCLNKTERMDLLLTLKRLVGKSPSNLSCDIVTLLERETELILRNIPSKMLTGLRQRIVQRFIQFCKNTHYNPAVADFLPIPNKKVQGARTKMWEDTHSCRSCGRFLRTKEFAISARATHLGVCLFCFRQGNRGRDRTDHEPYRLILEELREKEARLVLESIEEKRRRLRAMELKALDHVVKEQHRERLVGQYKATDVNNLFKADEEEPITETKVTPTSDRYELLVDVQDIFFLVSEVWDNRSALSGCSELADLTLCRWILSEPWAPWNSIVVTRKEAELHTKLRAIPLGTLYSDAMLTRVRQHLVIAKNAFMRLCLVGKVLTQERWELRNTLRMPEDTNAYRQLRRHKRKDDGVPLYLMTAEQRHKPTVQPPDVLLPVIRGELEMKDVGITSLKELWPLPETIKKW